MPEASVTCVLNRMYVITNCTNIIENTVLIYFWLQALSLLEVTQSVQICGYLKLWGTRSKNPFHGYQYSSNIYLF